MKKLILIILLSPLFALAQQGKIKVNQVDTTNVTGIATQAKVQTLLTQASAGATYSPKAGSSSITTVGTLVAGSIPYSLLTGTPTVPSLANPTGTVAFTAVNGMGGNAIRADGAPKADSAVIRSVANSYSLSAMQTKLNNYALTSALPIAANPTASVGGSAVNGSAGTFMRSDAAPKADTSVLQTVLNFFPKGDTRYARTSTNGVGANPTASATTTAVNGSAVTFMRSDGAPKIDTSVIRTVANSQTLAATQTALGLKANLASPTFTGTVTAPVYIGSGSQPFVSSGTATSSDFVAMGTGGAAVSTTQLQYDGATSTRVRVYERGASVVTLAAGDSYIGHPIGEQAVTTASSGTSALISGFAVRAPLLTVTGGSTVTDYATIFSQVGTSGATNTWNGWFKYGTTRVSAFKIDSLVSGTTGTDAVLVSHSNVVGSVSATAFAQTGKIQYNHTIFTPTTGNTITLINNQYNIVNPAGALLALTVTLPSSPANNDVVYIKFTQNVTTVTYAGGTVVDGITAPTAGGLTVFTYDGASSSWY